MQTIFAILVAGIGIFCLGWAPALLIYGEEGAQIAMVIGLAVLHIGLIAGVIRLICDE